jgi:tetratricopeptide (TPR) repeat protein
VIFSITRSGDAEAYNSCFVAAASSKQVAEMLSKTPSRACSCARIVSMLLSALLILLSMVVAGFPSELEDCTNASNPDEAIAGCSAIIVSDWADDEQLVMAFNNRANAHGMLGRVDAAIADYSRSLALSPHYVNARYNRASLFLDLGKLDLAIADFDIVLKLAPTRDDAMNNRALALLKAGRVDEAIGGFSNALRADPTNALAYNNRGVAWRRKNETARAIADFSTAINLNPEYTGAINNRGEMHLMLGRLDQAAADFRRALAIDPTHAAAEKNLRSVIDQQSVRR